MKCTVTIVVVAKLCLALSFAASIVKESDFVLDPPSSSSSPPTYSSPLEYHDQQPPTFLGRPLSEIKVRSREPPTTKEDEQPYDETRVPLSKVRTINDDGSFSDSDLDLDPPVQSQRSQSGWSPELDNSSPEQPSSSSSSSGVRAVHEHVLVEDTDSYPANAAVKLYMLFDGGVFVCSGSMVGPRTVITAAHCLWDDEDGWAEEVWVVPGQTERFWPHGDNGMMGRDLEFPYGWAKGRQYAVYDFSYNSYTDLGLINLDRDLGYRTGWYGYSDRGLPGSVHVRGYPADSPPGEDFDGTHQYYRQIDVKGWASSARRVVLNGELCGGDSGAGYYVVDDGDRYVIAVHKGGPESNSNLCGTGTEYGVRINGKKFDWIANLKANAPGNPERALLTEFVQDGYIKSLSPTIVDGGQMFTAKFSLYNAGFTSSGNVDVEAWLSSDDLLGDDDLKIGEAQMGAVGANSWRSASWSLLAPHVDNIHAFYVMIVFKSANDQYLYSDEEIFSDSQFLDTLEVGILTVHKYEMPTPGYLAPGCGSAVPLDKGEFPVPLDMSDSTQWYRLTIPSSAEGSRGIVLSTCGSDFQGLIEVYEASACGGDGEAKTTKATSTGGNLLIISEDNDYCDAASPGASVIVDSKYEGRDVIVKVASVNGNGRGELALDMEEKSSRTSTGALASPGGSDNVDVVDMVGLGEGVAVVCAGVMAGLVVGLLIGKSKGKVDKGGDDGAQAV